MAPQEAPTPPTAEEIEEIKRAAAEFLSKIEAVADEDRILVDSEKFEGPIGIPEGEWDSEGTGAQ